jgi:hypothetical protein
VGKTFDLKVGFNTAMDDSVDATKVVTLSGCGDPDPTPVKDLKWQDDQQQPSDHTITGSFTVSTHGTLTVTVHHDQAHSKAASEQGQMELDGNQTQDVASQDPDVPIRPNGDDYIWKVPCTGIDGYKAGPVSLKWVQGPGGQQWTETWMFQACPDPTLGKPLWAGDEHDYWINPDGSHHDRNVGRAAYYPYPGGGTQGHADSVGLRSTTFDLKSKKMTMSLVINSDRVANEGYTPATQTVGGTIQDWKNCSDYTPNP